jgi:hypothetical protein
MFDDFQRFVQAALLAIAESGHVGGFDCHRKIAPPGAASSAGDVPYLVDFSQYWVTSR